MPLEENPYTVPHLKELKSGQKLWGGQSCGSTLEFLINEGLCLLIFGKFSSPYALIKDPTFIRF